MLLLLLPSALGGEVVAVGRGCLGGLSLMGSSIGEVGIGGSVGGRRMADGDGMGERDVIGDGTGDGPLDGKLDGLFEHEKYPLADDPMLALLATRGRPGEGQLAPLAGRCSPPVEPSLALLWPRGIAGEGQHALLVNPVMPGEGQLALLAARGMAGDG